MVRCRSRRDEVLAAALLRALVATFVATFAACRSVATEGAAGPEWRATAEQLDARVREEIAQHRIPALALALVDGERVAWAQAWGLEDVDEAVPASLETVWRAGSVSKMFTDLAVMRLVEQGKLDLDAPVSRWLPEFAPTNPFTTPITLRQLMAHRAGLVREPPVGSYFDDSFPSLATTVASLDGTTVVYAPATRAKYSNAGIAVVGRVVEVVTGRPFADVVRDEVLVPMGLGRSAFTPTPEVQARLADAEMWTYWGTTFPAPTFELGMAPAGSLYADVLDLAQAMKVFLAEGRDVRTGKAVVEPESLEEMWKPQFLAPDASRKSGFGLGFHVDEFAGTRRVGHDGAIYGFSTSLALLPELELGVVALCSKDVAHGILQGIVDEALTCMARERRGEKSGERESPSTPSTTTTAAGSEIGTERARRLAGAFRSADGKKSIELAEQLGELWLCDRSRRARLRSAGGPSNHSDLLVTEDLVASGTRVKLIDGGRSIEVDGVSYARVETPRPLPPPAEWRGLFGEYGPDHNVLYVFEKDGALHALIEWFFDYPLTRESDDVWAFPDHGLYFGEKIVFERDADGSATRAIAAGVPFARRRLPSLGTPEGVPSLGTPEGDMFRIEPLRPVPELRAAALAASPPVESGKRPPELVDLERLDPTLRFDVRYATNDNFMGAVFYDSARAFLQKPAADALLRAHRSLAKEGFGLLIHDAYRPWFVTKMFWDGTPEQHHEMVADPAKGSRHNRGCAVDLTLCELATGTPVRMPSGYDEFSTRANPWYPGGTSEERWLRDLLRRAMEAEGFTVYEHEWWHFDFGEWREYPVMNRRFEEIGAGATAGS